MPDDVKPSDNQNLPDEQPIPKVAPKVDFEVDETELEASDNPAAESPAAAPKRKRLAKLRLHWPPSKKEALVTAGVVIICGLVIAFLLTQSSNKPIASAAKKTPLKPVIQLVPSTLSGLLVAPSVNLRPVTGVMVENSDQARPQSGLSQAGVVFEAIAEGGITRFLALYQDTAPGSIGPIRSVRPYYLQWALGFDASIAHVGGSPDALADIGPWGVKNLDEFYNGGSYQRIASRAAPHNVYTSIAALNQLEASKGYSTSTFSSFPRKADTPSKTPNARSINLNIDGPDYAVHYDYNASSDSYNRSEAGVPMIDANTNAQLNPKVVIALVVPLSQGALDASGAYYSDYNVLGSGQAYVFEDGSVVIGQWTKAANNSQLSFSDSSGQPIKLNAGQTWITAMSSPALIAYTP